MKKKLLSMLAVVMTMAFVGACGSSSMSYDMSASTNETAMEYESSSVREDAGGGDIEITSENGIEASIESNRKLIKTVWLDVQTKEFDEMLEYLTAKVQEMGGYTESSSISGNNYYYESTRDANYTVRIPSDKLDQFVQVVGEKGNISYKSEEIEDVTLEYVDVESHKKALEAEQERLLELLEMAESMEDIIAIESKLSEVRYQLENYGTQMRVLENQIDYSTVHISVQEVERITEAKERTFFEEIADRFSDSLYHVVRGCRSFVITFIGSIPILIVWAVLIFAAYVILRKVLIVKKPKENKKLFTRKNKNNSSDEEE